MLGSSLKGVTFLRARWPLLFRNFEHLLEQKRNALFSAKSGRIGEGSNRTWTNGYNLWWILSQMRILKDRIFLTFRLLFEIPTHPSVVCATSSGKCFGKWQGADLDGSARSSIISGKLFNEAYRKGFPPIFSIRSVLSNSCVWRLVIGIVDFLRMEIMERIATLWRSWSPHFNLRSVVILLSYSSVSPKISFLVGHQYDLCHRSSSMIRARLWSQIEPGVLTATFVGIVTPSGDTNKKT